MQLNNTQNHRIALKSKAIIIPKEDKKEDAVAENEIFTEAQILAALKFAEEVRERVQQSQKADLEEFKKAKDLSRNFND